MHLRFDDDYRKKVGNAVDNLHTGQHLTLDCKDVSEFSSIGVDFLIEVQKRALLKNAEIRLINVNGTFLEVLNMCGVTRFIKTNKEKR